LKIIKPQPGPQESFLTSCADIGIYGGAAGGGKSWALLLEALRWVTRITGFYALFFRRNTTQIRNPGGLWDESMKLYPLAGGTPVQQPLEWRWPNDSRIKMAYLDHESDKLDWQGSQIPLIIFDELTHFSMEQFFYMMSRNRSLCGVKPYIRASCNPDADSWVATFIEWWIDQETGFAIPERSGVLRWFVRINDVIIWRNTREELIQEYGRPDLPEDDEAQCLPKSVTFIAAKLSDNKLLMKADPGYLASLKAMSFVERERLLGGNWKVRPAAGLYFKRSDVRIIPTVPNNVQFWVRHWDLAATEVSETNPDPDWTAGVLMGQYEDGRYVIAHCEHVRVKSAKVRSIVQNTASQDGYDCKVGINQDPGQAGKEQAESYVTLLNGYPVMVVRETGSKVSRADPFAAQWQNGMVDVVRGNWNEAFFGELEAFPSKDVHDDQVDAVSGAYHQLLTVYSMSDVL
jgi:predicted phage terminase large subunit-like protein